MKIKKIMVFFDQEDFEKIKLLAEKEKRSVKNFVEFLILQKLEEEFIED